MVAKNNKQKTPFLIFFKNVILFWFGINFIVLVNTRFLISLGIKLPTISQGAIFFIAVAPALLFTLFPNIIKNTIFLNRGEKYVTFKTGVNSFFKISFVYKCVYLFSLTLVAIFLESMSCVLSMYANTFFGENISIFIYALFLIFTCFYLFLLFKAKTFKNIHIEKKAIADV